MRWTLQIISLSKCQLAPSYSLPDCDPQSEETSKGCWWRSTSIEAPWQGKAVLTSTRRWCTRGEHSRNPWEEVRRSWREEEEEGQDGACLAHPLLLVLTPTIDWWKQDRDRQAYYQGAEMSWRWLCWSNCPHSVIKPTPPLFFPNFSDHFDYHKSFLCYHVTFMSTTGHMKVMCSQPQTCPTHQPHSRPHTRLYDITCCSADQCVKHTPVKNHAILLRSCQLVILPYTLPTPWLCFISHSTLSVSPLIHSLTNLSHSTLSVSPLIHLLTNLSHSMPSSF